MNADELIRSGLLEAYVLGQTSPEEARLVERMRGSEASVRAELVAIETALGEPLPEIQRFVAHHQIGLLALTTHGRSGLSRVLFGSVAQQLIQQLTIPMLLFHPAEDHGVVTL